MPPLEVALFIPCYIDAVATEKLFVNNFAGFDYIAGPSGSCFPSRSISCPGRDIQFVTPKRPHECEMRPFLANRGIEVIETEFGERIQQLDNEPASHIVLPAVHKLRTDVARVFAATIGTDAKNSDVHYLVLFNRFYQPDIDLATMSVKSELHLSTSYETGLPMLWIGLLAGRLNRSLAATSGVSTDRVRSRESRGVTVRATRIRCLRATLNPAGKDAREVGGIPTGSTPPAL